MFGSEGLEDLVVRCEVMPELRPPKTDHIPIGTTLDISKVMAPHEPRRNFRLTDWEDFENSLKAKMDSEPAVWGTHHERGAIQSLR